MTNSTDNTLTYNRILERAMGDAEEAMPDLPKLPELQCFADSARGLYIPQYFAESIDRDAITGVNMEDLDCLLGEPEQDSYWDVWSDVVDNAVIKDTYGQEWTLEQDGDLWLVPIGYYDAWEAFQQEVEDIDAYEVANESSEWDWVIYYYKAMELCQAVPGSVLHDAEAQWLEFNAGCDIADDFGLFEMAGQLASLIVINEIAQAVEQVKDELIDLSQTAMDNIT